MVECEVRAGYLLLLFKSELLPSLPPPPPPSLPSCLPSLTSPLLSAFLFSFGYWQGWGGDSSACLIQAVFIYSWLTWNSQRRPGLPLIHRDLPASASQMLWLKTDAANKNVCHQAVLLLLWDKVSKSLASKALGNQGQPWTLDPPTSRVLRVWVCTWFYRC